MRKHISIEQLRPGMYVVGLDLSWFKTPYLRHRRRIHRDQEVRALHEAGVRIVEIDTARGDDVLLPERASVPSHSEQSRQRSAQSFAVGAAHAAAQLPVVRAAYTQMLSMVDTTFTEVQAGLALNGVAVCGAVRESVARIAQRPQTTLLLLLQEYDATLFSHAAQTSLLSVVIGHGEGYVDPAQLEILGLGAVLHDIGQLRLPRAVLDQADHAAACDPQVWHQHPELGASLLAQSVHIPPESCRIVREHHEQIDGSGYPNGLTGAQLSPWSQIVGLADVYLNLRSGRRHGTDHEAASALDQLAQYGRTGQFDPDLVERVVEFLREALELAEQVSAAGSERSVAESGVDQEGEDEGGQEAPVPAEERPTHGLPDASQQAALKPCATLVDRLYAAYRCADLPTLTSGAQALLDRVDQLQAPEASAAARVVAEAAHCGELERIPQTLRTLERALGQLHGPGSVAPTRAAPAPPSLPALADLNVRVVIVDPQHTTRRLLCNLLRFHGVQDLRLFADGEVALAALRQQGADVVIAECDLPRMSGIALLRAMRQTAQLAALPVFLMTRTSIQDDVLEAASLGVSGYLLRPFSDAALIQRIHGLCVASRTSLPRAA